jgi:site-specific DNA-methyltransferase (adenine-specific)
MSKYCTTTEAAEYLKITPARVRQFILEGRLESEKIGRDHMISEKVLKEFALKGRKNVGRPCK